MWAALADWRVEKTLPQSLFFFRILGGGAFKSRLFNEVRTERGLAYSVGSRLGAGWKDPGSFVMGAGTRQENVTEVIEILLAEVSRLRTEPVPQDELDEAKEGFLNAFVFASVTPGQVLSRRMRLDYYDAPADELARVKELTLAVTAADILRVTRKHLTPETMAIVAVGDREVLTKALAPFGTPVEMPLEEAP